MTTTQPDRLDRIESAIERNSEAIAKIEQSIARLENVSEKWDERFNRLTSTVLTIALGLIASATVAVIVPQALTVLGDQS